MSDSYTANWCSGFRGSAIMPADAAQAELEKIRKKNGGELAAQVVVAVVAKNSRHKLRPFFNWDDTAAANLHRVEQARLLMRSIVIGRSDVKGESRIYELMPSRAEPRQQVYGTMDDVMKDPVAREKLLQCAICALRAMERRYGGLRELAVVFRALDDV